MKYFDYGRMRYIVQAGKVKIIIRGDGRVMWISTWDGCILRIGGIKTLTIHDNRRTNEQQVVKARR